MQKLTLDTMVLQDYWKQRPRKDVTEALLELARTGQVDLAVTARIREDIPDEPLAGELNRLFALNVTETASVTRADYWVIGRDRVGSDEFVAFEKELGSRRGKGQRIPGWRDLDHLHAHFLEGRDVFLTWDEAILGLADELKARFGLVVLRPDVYLKSATF